MNQIVLLKLASSLILNAFFIIKLSIGTWEYPAHMKMSGMYWGWPARLYSASQRLLVSTGTSSWRRTGAREPPRGPVVT